MHIELVESIVLNSDFAEIPQNDNLANLSCIEKIKWHDTSINCPH